jgi:multidrug efflux system membrane fusion protein
MNNTVDPSTGTIQLKATFENNENALAGAVRQRGAHPHQAGGRGAGALSGGAERQKGIRVRGQAGQTVRPVMPGAADGLDVDITSGLAAGERLVTDGQLRLVPGARVEVKPAPTGKGAGG